MRTVVATRYVTPLREGGSLPAVVEGDDQGLYVAKFRGAGHGAKALIAEVVVGELARAAGLRVPEIVRLEVDGALGRNERDDEIRSLLRGSVGTNLGVDFLPGSVTFDPATGPAPEAGEASAVVWFDAFVKNQDRTPRNPNLLGWHHGLWLIDHGSSLHFHHSWDGAEAWALSPFAGVKDHVLLPWASRLGEAGERLAGRLGARVFERALAEVPDAWLEGEPRFSGPGDHRAAYLRQLERRLAAAPRFLEEAERARALLV